MLASAMVILCQSPDLMARVRTDRALLRPFCEEVLRVESPVQWLVRHAKADTEIGGTTIPGGSQVLVLYASGNRDAARFDDPDRFVIDRPNVAKHALAFGHGPHLCLGAPLARLEGQAAIEVLLDRLTNIRLVEEKSDLSHIESFHFRAPKVVHISFDAV
jgi:cytochrome P450